MPSASFTVADFNLSTSWTYTADEYLVLSKSPSVKTADKTFTISGIDMSTVNSVILTWDVTASASGSTLAPTKGYGYAYARVYQGASTSSTYAYANAETFDLTSYVGTSTSVTCRFYYYPSDLPSTCDYGSGYGIGSCTGTVYFKNVKLTVTYGEEKDDAGNGAWIGDANGKARKMKNMYIGVDDKARKIKAAWIGDANGKARLFYRSEVLTTITGSVCYYRTSSYPLSIGRTSGQVGPTSTANQGAIVMFDFTNYDASRISTSQNVTVVLHFAGTNYLSDVRKILPDAGLVPYYNSSTENSTSFTSFKGKTNSAHGGTVNGQDITLTFTGSQLKTWVTSNLVTPTSSGKKFLTFGVRINYNNTNLYDTTNPPTISFYYS